jgi:hypothetical protein
LSAQDSKRLREGGSASAAAPLAGYIAQLRRALFRLAQAGPHDRVGVETLDDVATVKQTLAEYEQDKLTLSLQGNPITNRSHALWRTLDIWTNIFIKDDGVGGTAEFFFITNRTCSGSVIQQLAVDDREDRVNEDVLASLLGHERRGEATALGSIQELINRVIAKGPEVLLAVIRHIHVTVEPDAFGDSLIEQTIALLHISDRVDARSVYRELFGWMTDAIITSWEAQVPAWIEARAFDRQLETIIVRAKRARVVAHAARVIPVSSADKAAAKTHRFVDHLALIDMDEARIDTELLHYVRFGREKLRLLEEGVILRSDMDDRGDRLHQSWEHVREKHCLIRTGLTPIQIGWKIFLDAASHREPLAGEPMDEAYMTIGHFHRLADDDRVYWHPDFRSGEGED